MTDPIADALTRIRNANLSMHDEVPMPSSKQKLALAEVLKREGYIPSSYQETDNAPPRWEDIDDRHEVLARAGACHLWFEARLPAWSAHLSQMLRHPTGAGRIRHSRAVYEQGSDERPRGTPQTRRRRDHMSRLVIAAA